MIVIRLGQGLLPASSDLPGSIGRAGLERPPIWSCSGRGLPSLPCRHGSWWALTPPLHPYPALSLRAQAECRTVSFLWHFPGIAPSGRYPASCPVEPGLSSIRHSACKNKLSAGRRRSAGSRSREAHHNYKAQPGSCPPPIGAQAERFPLCNYSPLCRTASRHRVFCLMQLRLWIF